MSITVDSFDCRRPIADLVVNQECINFIPAFEKKHDCKVHYYVLTVGEKNIRLISYIEFFNEASYNLFALKYL